MSTITSDVRVAAPAAETFEKFTDFNEYATFMSSVDTVRTDEHGLVHFGYSIGPIPREFVIEVAVDRDARTLTWHATTGPRHSGTAVVTEDSTGSHVSLHAEFEPHGAVESTGDALGLVQSRVDKDLHRFAAWVSGNLAPDTEPNAQAPSQRLTNTVFGDER